jgi:hypothetical protein
MKNRQCGGQSIAELPAVLWVLFLMLTFPLLNLATVGLRYTFCTLAVQEAATEAAMSKTFYADAAANDPSARNAADSAVRRVLARFTGLTRQNFTLRLVTTNLDSGMTTRQETPLAQPADTNQNVYMMEPELVADVQPLVTMKLPGVDIPGLTSPLRADITARKYCENPQGLTQ